MKQTIREFNAQLEQLVKAGWVKYFPEELSENLDLTILETNIVYKTLKVQVQVMLMKFKPNSDHTIYENYIGEIDFMMEFKFHPFKNELLKQRVEAKLIKLKKLIDLLTENSVKEFLKHDEGDWDNCLVII